MEGSAGDVERGAETLIVEKERRGISLELLQRGLD